jgi:uncharacterized protein (DUF924 family)
MNRIEYLLEFWFGSAADENQKPRPIWFGKDPAFDHRIRSLFLGDYEQVAAGLLEAWKDSAAGCLALILLLDQFPRNMFRGTAQAFATDAAALCLARHALEHGIDQKLPSVRRMFIYLPFEHSESLEDQLCSERLFEQFRREPHMQSSIAYAIKHRQVIERFGRFPHRNIILGRASSAEEITFLSQAGSSF